MLAEAVRQVVAFLSSAEGGSSGIAAVGTKVQYCFFFLMEQEGQSPYWQKN
jgi:hypothetical protein